MIVLYLPVLAKKPIPTLGGRLLRYRPVLAVQLSGLRGTHLRDALLDTGSDDTVFTDNLATLLGMDLRGAEERQIHLVGRPHPVLCRFAPVQLQITDGLAETYQWTTVVGFVAAPLRYNLLGHAGFFNFFDADFRGASREVALTPNQSFPGRRI